MKTLFSFLVASMLAVISVSAYSGESPGPVVKCHPKVCSNHGSIPVESGKGNCKAHPGSCK